jgi:uncharacterized alkaline shock family protein YloU
VTIDPAVLVTIARLTALATPGVARLSPSFSSSVSRLLGRAGVGEGVRIDVEDDAVSVDVYVVAESTVNMLRMGQQIQTGIARAIRDIVGMDVREVNVHIQDVESPSESS